MFWLDTHRLRKISQSKFFRHKYFLKLIWVYHTSMGPVPHGVATGRGGSRFWSRLVEVARGATSSKTSSHLDRYLDRSRCGRGGSRSHLEQNLEPPRGVKTPSRWLEILLEVARDFGRGVLEVARGATSSDLE